MQKIIVAYEKRDREGEARKAAKAAGRGLLEEELQKLAERFGKRLLWFMGEAKRHESGQCASTLRR